MSPRTVLLPAGVRVGPRALEQLAELDLPRRERVLRILAETAAVVRLGTAAEDFLRGVPLHFRAVGLRVVYRIDGSGIVVGELLDDAALAQAG